MDDIELDPAIIKALPPGCAIVYADSHGKTNWAKGLKVEVEADGEEKAYFLKITERDRAVEMALGEFESQKAMRAFIPENTSPPLAFGPLESDPSKAFFMVEFRDLDTIKPSAEDLAAILFKLHKSSVSPTGKFGFPVTTFKGYVPLDNTWTDSWEEWFNRQFRLDIKFEQSIRGPDPEMDELFEEFSSKVIPRLLIPLQTDGRSIKPSLCHTDIWHGNIHLDSDQTPIIFDSCCVYGHHEMEMGMFHGPRYGWDASYLEEYLKLMGRSEPKEDFDDRVSIYAMRNYIVTAGLWQHWAHLREFVKEEMRRLIAKYPDGYEGFRPLSEREEAPPNLDIQLHIGPTVLCAN